MTNIPPRILFISSANPLVGPGIIGMEQYQQFKNAGFEIDMMTLYPVKDHPEILYVYEKKKEPSIWKKIKNKYHRLTNTTLPGIPYFFFYRKESRPPVPISIVLKKISKEYDLLVIYFWQWMLSFRTVNAIYEKLNHPVVFFVAPDYSHMSGGCHFPVDCIRYHIGCGCCPAIHSNNKNDFTHWNVKYREKIYEKIKPIVFGNSYMQSFYQKSLLLRNARTVIGKYVANTELFKPMDKQRLRTKYQVNDEVDFIIAFGCQRLNDVRKGMVYLFQALQLLHDSMKQQERKKVLLLVAGYSFKEIQQFLPFQSKELGMIPITQLSEFYSLADVFVCPSVNDAGPSMVLQSITCGTPVVGFEMGAMIDFVKDKGTGYCAKYKDCYDLFNGINHYLKMSREERKTVSIHCRNMVVKTYTLEAKIKQWLDLFEKYRNNS